MKLTGNIRMPGNPGVTYWVRFRNYDNDGSILRVNGSEIINDWNANRHYPEYKTSGWILLVGGQTYSYERFFHHQSNEGGGWFGDLANLRQEWEIWNYRGWSTMNIQNDFE